MDWADVANASVVSTGSYADDVTVPEVKWDVMKSSSTNASFPVNESPRQQLPAPDPVPSSNKMKPEVANVDFRSAAMGDWTNGADQSFVSATSSGACSDDVTVPELDWYMSASSSFDTSYPVNGSSHQRAADERLPVPFTTYPSPDPVPGNESTRGFWGPFYVYSEWNPHDNWLEASRWTTKEDIWQHHTYYNADKLSSSHFLSQQKYFDSFPDQSLGGVIYESLEGASGDCWPFDNDYFDDVLSVMAKAADNSTAIHALA